MNTVTKAILGVVLAAVLAVAGTWYLWQGDRQAVLSTESPARQEQLEALLAANGIDFQIDERNRVTVMSEDIAFARALADQASLTQPQRNGFELFENEDYGATEFVQRINYQRALQAELERTMIRIAGIRNARVHILQPARSTFFKRDSVSRAAVVLELERDIRLSSVAPSVAEVLLGAIDGLSIDDVKIISGRGDVVATSNSAQEMGFSQQSGAEALERRLTETVYRVLSPLYERSAIGVSVSVQLDRATRNVRRQQTPSTEGPEARLLDPSSADLVTEDISLPPGDIQRIGVGVMLPHPTSAEEILQIENLLRSGLGISDARGDVLSVMAYHNVDEPVMGDTRPFELANVDPSPAPRQRLADVVPLSSEQFNYVLVIVGVLFIFLLIFNRLRRRSQRKKVVEQVSDWVQEAASGS